MRKMILLAIASFLWKQFQGRMRTRGMARSGKAAAHRSRYSR